MVSTLNGHEDTMSLNGRAVQLGHSLPLVLIVGSRMLHINLVSLKVSSADLNQETELLTDFVTDPGVKPCKIKTAFRTYALSHTAEGPFTRCEV